MTDGPTTPPPETPRPAGLPGPSKSLFERAKDIILQPQTEWGVIDAEPATVRGLFTGYAMILAAIGPIAGIIGQQLIGLPISYSVIAGLVGYAVSLGLVFINSLIIDALAPTFDGTKNHVQATKLAVYCATPGWLIGIFNIIPQLALLMLLLMMIAGLYGFYLLYLGLPRLMRVPKEKVIGYVLVVVAAWILIYFTLSMLVVSVIMSVIFGAAMMGGGMSGY